MRNDNYYGYNDPGFEEMIADGIMADSAFRSVIGTQNRSIEMFRVFLMFCACVAMLGLPIDHSSYLESVCGFAPIAFFILSGMLVLGDPEEREARLKRAIVRTAIAFGVLLVFNVVVNILLFRFFDTSMMPVITSKRLWFDFLVLNVWPFTVGDAIWYVHSLLYAYIIIYLLCKTKLIRFDFIIVTLLLAFTVVYGELNGIFALRISGYNFFPPNFFNRALPYLLLGGILARGISLWSQLNPFVYIAGIIAGAGLVYGEPKLLGYFGVPGHYGHLIGMGMIAVSACLLLFWDVVNREIDECESASFYDFFLSRRSTNFIYYVYQQTAMVFGFIAVEISPTFFDRISPYLGLITFGFLFFAVTAVLAIYRFILVRTEDRNSDDPG